MKKALDQALRLRGTRSFETRAHYEAFVNTVVQRMNARVAKLLATERTMLKPLPARRTAEFEEIPARVSKFAIFTLKGVLYSVPSQLIGHRLMVASTPSMWKAGSAGNAWSVCQGPGL